MRYLVTVNLTISPVSYIETNVCEVFATMVKYGSRCSVEPIEDDGNGKGHP